MTQACSALAFVLNLMLFGCLWIDVDGQNVCEQRVPIKVENKDKKDWIVRQVCCPGYMGIPGYCQPRCTPSCVRAKCTAPQQCTCNQGYQTIGNSEYSTVGCQPKCKTCRYGDCMAPNFCRCWPSYVRRSLQQGCQPIAKMLLPAEECVKKVCSCWQEYFSWTPLLKVVPRCVKICQNDEVGSKGCLNLGKCVCNSQNQYLVCEGEENDLPQQYACEAIKKVTTKAVKAVTNGTTLVEWEVRTDTDNPSNQSDSTVERVTQRINQHEWDNQTEAVNAVNLSNKSAWKVVEDPEIKNYSSNVKILLTVTNEQTTRRVKEQSHWISQKETANPKDNWEFIGTESHSTSQTQAGQEQKRNHFESREKAEKSSSGQLIWPIALGCFVVVLVVVVGGLAVFLKPNSPVSLSARTV